MVPWAFGVPLVFVSALGLILNGFVLLVVLGLGKQVNSCSDWWIIRRHVIDSVYREIIFLLLLIGSMYYVNCKFEFFSKKEID